MVELKELVDAAIEARTHALTFRTSVGVAYETYDGKVFTGFNLQTYGKKHDMHAEEVGIIRMIGEGYMGTDVMRMVVVFKEVGIDKPRITVPCLDCLSMMSEFLHPYIQIIEADENGKVHWRNTMERLLRSATDLGTYFWPNNDTRLDKPKLNFKSKLPLAQDLSVPLFVDVEFKRYCEEILKVQI